MKYHVSYKVRLVSSTAAMLLPCLFQSGCSLVPQKYIHTEIDIPAPPQAVWTILMDNARYPSWNPYHVRVEGDLHVGEALVLEIHKPNGERIEIEPRVIRISPLQELTWGGGIPGVFYGEHTFLLSALDKPGEHTAHTRLVHKEHFSGIAVPFASLDAIEEGYQQMNRALRDEVIRAQAALAED